MLPVKVVKELRCRQLTLSCNVRSAVKVVACMSERGSRCVKIGPILLLSVPCSAMDQSRSSEKSGSGGKLAELHNGLEQLLFGSSQTLSARRVTLASFSFFFLFHVSPFTNSFPFFSHHQEAAH